MRENWKSLLILAIVVVSVFYLYPTAQFYRMEPTARRALEHDEPSTYYDLQKRAINLGLDLQGGIHLVMEVQTEGLTPDEARDAVDRAQEVIRNRVDQFGVAEPTIQRQGENRIIVELPGLQDVDRAKNLIGQTALLEFQLVEPDADRDRLLQRIDGVLSAGRAAADTDTAAADADSAGADETPSLFGQQSADATDTAATTPVEVGASLLSRLVRIGSEVAVQQRDLVAVKALLSDPRARSATPGDVEFVFSSSPEGPSGSPYYFVYLVRAKPEMTGNMVADAQVSVGQSVEYLGQPIVDLWTSDEGVRVFRRITGAHIGERLAIVLDGAVYSAPTIQTKIMNGRSIITGSKDQDEAKDLAIVLRAGALPARVEIIEDRTVGPSLGRDSIEQSRVASIIATAAVALFMLLYYRTAGLLADLALTLNVLFLMAILAGFHATLTLPGIAGIILTIGMAVDANVLIYERIREELRAGKTTRAAVDAGFSNALSAIVDSNLTTLISGVVLYEFGTGPIRGFALTLCIGIATTLFSALVVTRALIDLWIRRSPQATLNIGSTDVFANARLPFMSLRKVAFIGSGALLALGVVSVVAIHGLKAGIDFSGGTLVELHFDPPVSLERIRQELGRVTVDGRETDLSASEIKIFGGPGDILIRVSEGDTGTDMADAIKDAMRAGVPESVGDDADFVRRQEKVGPRIGQELTGDAVRAVLVSLGLILVYVAWRFKQFNFGIAAIIATFHDVILTVGALSLLDVEITLTVVAAILTIVGYTLNDKIVVFDRIRENLRGVRRLPFIQTLDISINETLSRTVVTGGSVLLAVIVLMIWGGAVIRDFTITLLIGIVIGTYSSIFIASPALYYGHLRTEGAEKKK